MTHMTRYLYFAVAAGLVAAPAAAQTSSSTVAGLVKVGDKVEVIDDRGHETKGKVGILSADSMSIVTGAKTTDIPFANIRQIARPHDGLANGALVGLAAGAAFGALAATVGSDDCSGEILCLEGPRFVVGAALVFGGIGAGLGVAVDALIHRDRMIYRNERRPQAHLAPVLGAGRRGAMVSVMW